jgi:acyl carrier protein
MVPSAFVTMDSLPLTRNGKIDREALAALNADPTLRRSEGPRPRTATEKAVADIWSQVLGVQDIGVNDNFFALGGHSLLAIQVVNRVRSVLGVQLPLHVLFESPTLAGIAAASDQIQSTGATPALV